MKNESNKENKKVEIEIERLDFDDAKIDLNLKTDKIKYSENYEGRNTSSGSSTTSSFNDSNTSSGGVETSSNASDMKSGATSGFDSREQSGVGSPSEGQPIADNGSAGNSSFDNGSVGNAPVDNRSLKEKATDARDNLKQKADNIKNAPENIKNKFNDAKDKIDNAKNKAQQVPENLRKKRDQLKDSWNNRPRNFNDAKKRAKNSGKNLKDRAKNGIKNTAKNAASKAKGAAKGAVENSKAMEKVKQAKQRVEKAKKAVERTKKAIQMARRAIQAAIKAIQAIINIISVAIECWPVTVAILAIVIIIACIMVIVPGSRGNSSEGIDGYSKTDQKTLEKIRTVVDSYPSADAALAMEAVVYPYFEILWGSKTKELVSKEYLDELTDETTEEYEEGEDQEEITQEEGDDNGHDPYLELFRKSSYRKNFKTLLKKYHNDGEEAFYTYLKDTYFSKDNAYESMFSGSVDAEGLKESIIEDLKNGKDSFINYVFESAVCSSNLVSAGTVEIDDMLKSNILVDVKVPSCTSGTNVWDCESVYSSPITLKQYSMGGANEEFNTMDVEKAAAQMLAIKSYVVQRGKSQGWGVKKDESGNYVVTIRNNTNDLVYCDVDLGCQSGNTEVGSGNNKRPPMSSEQRKIYEEAWEKIADKFIYDKNNKQTVGAFCMNRIKSEYGDCSFCTKGNCLSHNELENYTNTSYDTIISMQYSNYSMIQVEGDFANVTLSSGTSCSDAGNLDIDDSNFVYYAQTDYPSVGFCGRKLSSDGDGLCANGSSICTSGCGLVSLSMVTATLTQNYSISPLTLNNEVRSGTDCGPNISGSVGTSMFPYIAQKYGLTYSYKAFSSNIISDIKQALDEGALIITSVCGGLKSNNRYYNGSCGGHFIVVRGYEGDSVIISDPYQNSRLKSYGSCLLKEDGKCKKHKMSFDTFYSDLKQKNGSLYIIKGNIPFSQLKSKINNDENSTENSTKNGAENNTENKTE